MNVYIIKDKNSGKYKGQGSKLVNKFTDAKAYLSLSNAKRGVTQFTSYWGSWKNTDFEIEVYEMKLVEVIGCE